MHKVPKKKGDYISQKILSSAQNLRPARFTQCMPGVLSQDEKRPWREARRLYPCCTEIKNAGSCTSTPPHVVTAWCLIKHRDCKLWAFRLGYRVGCYVGTDVAEEGAASVVHPEDGGSVFLRNTARCHRTENPESLRNYFAALRCKLCGEYFGQDFLSFGTRRCVFE